MKDLGEKLSWQSQEFKNSRMDQVKFVKDNLQKI